MNEKKIPKVTVIIPSYNHEKFIKKAINSVLNQTYQDFELIIADDASPDNSVEIIKSMADSRIIFYQFKENKGAVDATNFCIKKARGEYIALLNSDDSWKLDKLQKQVEFLDNNQDIGAVFTDALFIDEEGKELTKEAFQWADVFTQENRTNGQWYKRFFFNLNCLCHPSIMIRKSIYDNTNLYNYCLRQLPDFEMWLEILKFTSIHVLNEKLVVFKILSSGENASVDTPTNKNRNMLELLLIMKDFFTNMPSEIFLDGFKELLVNKNASTQEEILCEQAFLFLNTNNDISHIYKMIGIEKIYKLLLNEKTRGILKEEYDFTDKDFFALTGSMEIRDYSNKNITQIVANEMKKKLYPSKKLYNFFKKLYNKK